MCADILGMYCLLLSDLRDRIKERCAQTVAPGGKGIGSSTEVHCV